MSQEIQIGPVTITRVEEMHGPIMPPEVFFPTMPAEAWNRNRDWLVPDHLDEAGAMVKVAMQPWLLRSAGKNILVDTGVGNDKSRPSVDPWDHLQLDFVGALAAAGITPDDVDLVVNTHLHVDHVGWNTTLRDGEWVPTFPNATYLMPRADVEFFNPANRPQVEQGVNQNVFADSVAPVLAAGLVQQWEDAHDIDETLRVEAAPGHTPGSSVIKLTAGDDHALFARDLIHTPLQLSEPGQDSCFCEDSAAAQASRRRLLGWAAERGAIVLPAHISGQGAFTIDQHSDAFALRSWAAFDRL